MQRGGFTRVGFGAASFSFALALALPLAACGGGSPPKSAPRPDAPPPDEDAYPAGTMSAPATDAQKVLGALRPKIRACYEDALKSDAKAEGVVRVQIKVGPDGDVTAATPVSGGAGGDTSLPRGVVTCITAQIKAAKFAPPGPSGATFEVPLSFTRKGE